MSTQSYPVASLQAVSSTQQPSPEPVPFQERYRDDPEAQLPQPEPESVNKNAVSFRQTHGRRFFKLLLFVITVVSIWLLFLSARWIYYRQFYKPQYDWPNTRSSLHDCIENDAWSPASDGSPNQFETSFEVPLSDSVLRFVSDGHSLGGHVDIITSDTQNADSATVHVKIIHQSDKVPNLTKACGMTRKSWRYYDRKERGVTILTPRYDWKYKHKLYPVKFEMKIILSEVISPPLIIDNFETDISDGSHTLADMSKTVFFREINLRGANGGIHAESVSLARGRFMTVNGDIEGTFNATINLGLYSHDGAIRADVGLSHVDEFPRLYARTDNGLLSANISLLTDRDDRGFFEVTTTTSNAPLEINFPSALVNSRLRYRGKTSNGPATITLNPSYEGYINLRSTKIMPKVVDHPEIEDPNGENRRKIISYSAWNTEISGNILWGLIPNGDVVVETTNAPLVLNA